MPRMSLPGSWSGICPSTEFVSTRQTFITVEMRSWALLFRYCMEAERKMGFRLSIRRGVERSHR